MTYTRCRASVTNEVTPSAEFAAMRRAENKKYPEARTIGTPSRRANGQSPRDGARVNPCFKRQRLLKQMKKGAASVTKDEELALIARVVKGDADAFEPLVREHQDMVYRLAYRMVGNEADAWDVSQDTFLKAYNALASFRGESRFSTWLYRLAGNCATDLLRSRKSGRVVSLDEYREENPSFDLPDAAPGPEEALETGEQRRAVEKALQALPEDYRKILTLRELGGLSYEEIAGSLSLELGTVKSRLNRARGKLCEILLRDGNISAPAASKNRKGGRTG